MVAIFLDENLKEVQRIESPSIEWLLGKLETHTCQVFFRKRLNGRFRSLKCTRNKSKLPNSYRSLDEVFMNPHGIPDLITVWDTTTRDWKSFYYDSVLFFTVYLNKGEKVNK